MWRNCVSLLLLNLMKNVFSSDSKVKREKNPFWGIYWSLSNFAILIFYKTVKEGLLQYTVELSGVAIQVHSKLHLLLKNLRCEVGSQSCSRSPLPPVDGNGRAKYVLRTLFGLVWIHNLCLVIKYLNKDLFISLWQWECDWAMFLSQCQFKP